MHDKSKRMQVIRLRETDRHALTRQVMRGGNHMSEEKKEMVERLAQKFVSLPDAEKSFVAGYMAGKEEERAKWEKKGLAVATA